MPLTAEKMPLLVLDVNLGPDRVASRVQIFEGQDYREVIDLFAKENKLNLKKYRKLMAVVSEQMEQILPIIKEESVHKSCSDGQASSPKVYAFL